MLIIDKKRDIQILKSMGASEKLIKRIFVFEGWMISATGAIIGLILGVGLSYAQQYFGILKLSSSASFVVESYPVKVQVMDMFYVLGMVLSVGFFAAYYPVLFITKKHVK
jgi:lipoprotein-releasing system permease protein